MAIKFWKNIFKKSEVKNHSVPLEFRSWVQKSIELMGRDGVNMEDDELQDFLIQNDVPDYEAVEIIIFLPTACVKKIFPNIKWLNEYIDYYSEQNQIVRKFKENERYMIMEEEVNSFWNSSPKNQWVNFTALRSSEFGVINQLLEDGGKLENAKLVRTTIVR